jgi:catechol-2,3-dioxygenase
MSSVQLGPIGHIALHVTDVGRSLKFYGDQLGMTKLFDAPSLAFFDNAGVRLMISAGESEPSGAR